MLDVLERVDRKGYSDELSQMQVLKCSDRMSSMVIWTAEDGNNNNRKVSTTVLRKDKDWYV